MNTPTHKRTTSALMALSLDLPPALTALLLTAITFCMLPALHRISAHPKEIRRLVDIQRSVIPAPPPPEDPTPPPPDRNLPPRALPAAPRTPPRLTVRPSFALDQKLLAVGSAGELSLQFQEKTGTSPVAEADLVFALANVDQPPQPVSTSNPLYPVSARARRVEGYAIAEFVVTANGDTDSIEVIESEPDTLFDAAVERAVRRWRFQPAMRDGQPVAVRVRQRIRFKLEDTP